MAEALEWKSENSSVVEHNLAKVGVASSNLVSRSFRKASLIGGFFAFGKGFRGSETRKAWLIIALRLFQIYSTNCQFLYNLRLLLPVLLPVFHINLKAKNLNRVKGKS